MQPDLPWPRFERAKLYLCRSPSIRGRILSALIVGVMLSLSLDGVQAQAEVKTAVIPDFADFSGALTLVEEIDCAEPHTAADFSDFPAGSSKVMTILGRKARVLPRGAHWSYMSFTLGKKLSGGKKLQAGKSYVLTLEYPEDAPRSLFVLNRGCETQRGFHTGITLGDQMGGYVNANPESLDIPLSGKWERWTQYFHLHSRYPDLFQPRDVNDPSGKPARTRTPEDGFRVIIVHLDDRQAPVSTGAACGKLRLHEVTGPIHLQYAHLPEGLPRRHVFWREEMADNVIGYQAPPGQWGVPDDRIWFEHKMKLMRFLGPRTFSKDLLEFGHNQGWKVSSTDWYVPTRSHLVDRWSEIIELCEKYGFDVIPYYEYYGSTGPKGLGKEKRCVNLNGKSSYTNYHWLENFNADVTDPDTLADAQRLLDETMIPYRGRVHFPAAWFRARPSALPVSYSDAALRRFEKATGKTAGSATRAQLNTDAALQKQYRAWWLTMRRQFLKGLRDHLREKLHDELDILFTWDPTEPGWTLPGSKYVVNDAHERWTRILKELQGKGVWWFSRDFEEIVSNGLYLEAMKTPRGSGGDDWRNSSPEADPENYQDEDGVMLTHTMHRVYSLTEESLSAFRATDDLAVIRHYCLNENAPNHKNLNKVPTGYFVADVERAGPYSMMAEARAVALGDPDYLGYLASNCWNHGFPTHARRFYANFLSLPAIESTRVSNASSEPEVIVRRIDTSDRGSWYALVNIDLGKKQAIIDIATRGTITHAPTGTRLGKGPGKLRFDLEPFELITLRVK